MDLFSVTASKKKMSIYFSSHTQHGLELYAVNIIHFKIFTSEIWIYPTAWFKTSLLSYGSHHYRWRTAYFDIRYRAVRVFVACHIHCVTGHSFILTSPRTRVAYTFWRAFGSGAVLTGFKDIGLSRLRFINSIFSMQGQRFNGL